METTEICAAPGLWLKLPGTSAVSWLALSNFVVSGVPFHCTTELELKPAPFTVNWNGCPEEGAFAGLNELIETTDTTKFRALEVTPLMTTVIWAVVGEAIKLAGTAAVRCVASTNVVARLAPFHCTVAEEVNPVPVNVRVKGLAPAVALFGLKEVSAGPFATSKFTAFDVTPPDATVMGTEAALAMRAAETGAVN